MILRLNTVGLALAAALIISAIAATSASAHYVITSNKANTSLTGSQVGNHTFTTAGQTVKCTTATVSATQSGTEVSDVLFTPSYAGCTYSSGAKVADWTMNGCQFLTTGVTVATGHGKTEVQCSPGHVIEIHLTNFSGTAICTLTIEPQTVGEGYTAVTSGGGVIDYTTTDAWKVVPHGSGGCSLLVSGKYSGVTRVEGFTDGAAHTAENKATLSVDS